MSLTVQFDDLFTSRITNAIIVADITMSTITVFISLIILYVLLTDHEHRGSFFTIYKVGLAYDIIVLLSLQALSVIPSRGFKIFEEFTETKAFLKLYFFIGYCFHTCQKFTNPFLCMNRVTAVLLPFYHERIWSSRWFPLCFLYQFCWGLLLGLCSVYFDHYLVIYPTGERFSMAVDTPEIRTFWKFTSIVAFGGCVLMFILYGIVIWRFRSTLTHHDQTSSRSSADNRRSLNLLRIAVWVLVSETIYCLFYGEAFLININYGRDFRVFWASFYTILDFYSCFPSYLLLFFCKPIRVQVNAMLLSCFCRRRKVSEANRKITVKSLS